MTIKFIKGMSDQPPINIWSKEWPNWSGVVPQVGDIVLLHFGDYNEECHMFKVTHRFIDGTPPDIVTCMIAEEKMKTVQHDNIEGVPAWYDDAKWFPLLDQNIGNVGLMNRTVILLEKNGVYKVRDLCCLNKTDLLKFRNFGRKSLNDCDDFLESKGIGFGNDVELIDSYHRLLMLHNNE